MRRHGPGPRLLMLCLLAAALGGGAAAPPAGAAEPFGCEASVLRGTVLALPAIEPFVANRGRPCATAQAATAALGGVLPAPLGGGAAAAATVLRGPAGRTDRQQVLAAGGVADLTVAALPALPIALPTAEIPDGVRNLTVPVPTLLQPLLGPSLTFGLGAAIDALLPDRRLPGVELLHVQGAVAYAGAQCRDGRAVAFGTAQVAGVSALGQALGVGELAERTLPLLDTASIDLSDLDLSKVQLPAVLAALAPATIQDVLVTVLRPALDALPPIEIPATLAQVKVTPGGQVRQDGRLTQQALRVQVSIAGQSVVDLVVGEASVSTAGVSCAAPADRGTATSLALACTKRRLVLVDVAQRGDRVRLLGAADHALVGRRVAIRSLADRRIVAHATVRGDGGFRASAPLPPRRLRHTNRARYQAQVGAERSLDLKLSRRMTVTGVRSHDGRVTISGRVSRPLGAPVQAIRVQRRVSCRRNETVKRIVPRRDGTFRVTVDAPDGRSAAVYRLATKVRKTTRSRKLFPTYTLPRGVNLRG